MLEQSFMQRLADQKRSEQEAERGRYRFVAGAYTQPFIMGERADRVAGLTGTEVAIAARVQRLLGQGREQPVVCLDIGGGNALTWIKLAHSFRRSVEQGKLALAVSNLSADRQDYTSVSDRNGGAGLSPAASKAAGSIHWLTATSLQLGKQRLALPEGKTMTLSGNVDLVHERASVTAWSKVPEFDIPNIAQLLSPTGTYMVSRNDTVETQPTAPMSAEGRARVAGIAAAHLLLTSEVFSLQRTDTISDGIHAGKQLSYVLFEAPEATRLNGSL